MKQAAPVWLIALAVVHLLTFTTATVLLVGIENTPYNAQDSQGRQIGFNDRLSSEHYAIILGNFLPGLLLSPKYVFDFGYLTASAATIIVAGTRIFAGKYAKAFFALQFLLLPVALLGAFVLVHVLCWIPTGKIDRETFVDIPVFNILVSSPITLAVSGAALLVIRSRQKTNGTLIVPSKYGS
jgi:hypothetical protein